MAIKYFGQYVSRKPAEEIHVFCDCANAVDTVDKMQFITRPDIFTKFNDIIHKLQDLSITVKTVKIISHLGILGNDMADRYANEMASKILKGEIVAPRNILVNDCYKIASDIVHNSWPRYWDNEQKGHSTYDFIPVVGTKVIFPSKRLSGVGYCRMFLHDTMLNSHSYRTGTADTPVDMHWKQQNTSYFIATDMTKNEKICLILYIILALLRSKIKSP